MVFVHAPGGVKNADAAAENAGKDQQFGIVGAVKKFTALGSGSGQAKGNNGQNHQQMGLFGGVGRE